MNQSTPGTQYPFDRPGIYRIRVIGYIHEDWSERLGGMTIVTEKQDHREPVTTLTGLLRDQSDLSGVLVTLYESQLSLLSVKLLKGDE